MIIGGDFNAHHPNLNPNNRKVNPTGTQIVSLLEQIPEVTLVTEPQATHIQGGTLDLTLVSTDLYPDIQWRLHPTLTSDHFAINITLKDAPPYHPPLPPPSWNVKKINWSCFRQELDRWSEQYVPPRDVNQAERDLVNAFHASLDKACPVASHGNRQYKDHYYYNDKVKELYARVTRLESSSGEIDVPTIGNCYK